MVPETDVINVVEEEKKIVPKDLTSLKEKISRTSQFLQELKVLSKDCQELEENQEKDKQIFRRRTLQVGAEIQDARDTLSNICQDKLPARQWKLLFESAEDTELLNGFDLDPSVQFFGIDWERDFGRCSSLSLHANLLEEAVNSDTELDLVLISKMLRDLTAIEADVLSHSEAVLRGRLSKSQRQLIFDEQNKYASMLTTPSVSIFCIQVINETFCKQQVSKSRSFRDTSGKSRPSAKYKKTKTTQLDKLTSSMSAHTIKCSNSDEDDGQTDALLDKKATMVSLAGPQMRRKSSSTGFMQNMSSMFKNIR